VHFPKIRVLMYLLLFGLVILISPATTISEDIPPVPEPPLPVIIDAAISINPNSLNLKSKGKWITCHIELPESYDAANINISTILLNDIVPAESKPISIGDCDGDGLNELMVKFSRSAVQSTIPLGSESADITVTGWLTDGTTKFQGTDTIKIVSPKVKPLNGKNK